jgi:SAM-dependent methyltransferase
MTTRVLRRSLSTAPISRGLSTWPRAQGVRPKIVSFSESHAASALNPSASHARAAAEATGAVPPLVLKRNISIASATRGLANPRLRDPKTKAFSESHGALTLGPSRSAISAGSGSAGARVLSTAPGMSSSHRMSWPHVTTRKPLALNFAESHSPFMGEWKGFESDRKHKHQARLAKCAVEALDPHNVSNQLDEVSSDRMAKRLESRGRDAHFRSLFTAYFPALHDCGHVVELGCGTGVVLRALLQDPQFRGRVTGLDQSQAFVTSATNLAADEGLDESRFFFETHDAQSEPKGRCGDLTASADAVVCHTLLSHVSDPQAVLESARKLAKPGALLVVMDGDYDSLTFAHAADPALGKRMDEALVSSVYAQTDVMRVLPKLLEQTGWHLESATGQCLSEVGHNANFWMSYAKAYLPSVKESGALTKGEIDAWWTAQQRAVKSGQFFASASYYTMIARAA